MQIDERNIATIEEVSKSQNVRLLNVFFIGPFIMYVGKKAKGITPLERNILYLIGLGSIIYNGKNYLENKDALQD